MGLRQALMALMDWAIDVPQRLLQCEAISSCRIVQQLNEKRKKVHRHAVSAYQLIIKLLEIIFKEGANHQKKSL